MNYPVYLVRTIDSTSFAWQGCHRFHVTMTPAFAWVGDPPIARTQRSASQGRSSLGRDGEAAIEVKSVTPSAVSGAARLVTVERHSIQVLCGVNCAHGTECPPSSTRRPMPTSWGSGLSAPQQVGAVKLGGRATQAVAYYGESRVIDVGTGCPVGRRVTSN